MNKKAGVIVFILYLPGVVALDAENFKNAFNNAGIFIRDILQNEYALYGIVFILLMILLRSIFVAGLKRLPLFEGAGGEGVNKLGQMIGWSLAALCTIGLFRYKGDVSIKGFMGDFLGPAGAWIGLIAALVTFLWLRKQFGENTKGALFFTGLACIVIDAIFNVEVMSLIGFLLIIISLIWMFGGRGHSREYHERDIDSEERKQSAISRLLDWWRRRKRKDVKKEEEIVEEAKKLESAEKRLTNLLRGQIEAINRLVAQFKMEVSMHKKPEDRTVIEEKTNLINLLKEEKNVLERELNLLEEEAKLVKDVEKEVNLFKRLLRLIHKLKIDEKRLDKELKDRKEGVVEEEEIDMRKELKALKRFVDMERLKRRIEFGIEEEEGEIKEYDKRALRIVEKNLDFMEKEFDNLLSQKNHDKILEELTKIGKSVEEKADIYDKKKIQVIKLERYAERVKLVEVGLFNMLGKIKKFIDIGVIPIEEKEKKVLEEFQF